MKKMQKGGIGGAKIYTGSKGKTTKSMSEDGVVKTTKQQGKKGTTEVSTLFGDKLVEHRGSKGKTDITTTKNYKVKEHRGSKGNTKVHEDKYGKLVDYFSNKKGLHYIKNTDSRKVTTYKKGGSAKKK